jgi:hypothetical protein
MIEAARWFFWFGGYTQEIRQFEDPSELVECIDDFA